MELLTNHAVFYGYPTEAPVFSHENHGRHFFRFLLEVPRLSGAEDLLPVVVSEDLLSACPVEEGGGLRITGQIRTFNSRGTVGRRLLISVFAETLEVCDGLPENEVLLTGALCKPPVLRRTPLGRDICDIMLAVSRKYHRTDYVPCILWGRTALETAELTVGARLELHGRLQSRKYLKVLEDRTEERTAYEVSVMEAFLLPDPEDF